LDITVLPNKLHIGLSQSEFPSGIWSLINPSIISPLIICESHLIANKKIYKKPSILGGVCLFCGVAMVSEIPWFISDWGYNTGVVIVEFGDKR